MTPTFESFKQNWHGQNWKGMVNGITFSQNLDEQYVNCLEGKYLPFKGKGSKQVKEVLELAHSDLYGAIFNSPGEVQSTS